MKLIEINYDILIITLTNKEHQLNINYKLIAIEKAKPGVVFNDRSVESHMANKGKKQLADANRGINQTYYECGKNHSNRTAILFLCSGEGTRAVIASDKRKAITEATVHHRTPLELLFESTPPDIGKIIVSIQKNDTLITNYLGKNNYFDRQQTPNNMSVITIDQPEVKTNRETNYPGGAGLIIEELLKDTWSRLLQDSCIDQLIIMDGEKLGYNTDELYQFIGFHVHHKNQLSVATYAPLPDPDKKFAHIDTINNQAYAGKKTPESLEKRSENHHLSGGVYLLDLSQRKNLKQLDATSEKKGKGDETFTYKETPPISLIEAANGQIGYYQHTRGELGRGIKDRKAFTANIREDSKKASLFLQDKGWIILPDMGIELANVQLNAVQPDNRVNLNSTLFLAGDLVIGENNEYYEGNIITAAKKEITIGRDNVFKKINLAGSIKLGDKNEIAGSTFLADVPAKYLDFIPLSKTTVLKNLTDLEKKLCNSQYKTTEKTIQIGNNCELNDCTLIGSFIIGDDVVLDSSLLVNYSEKPMIIPSKSVIKGTYIENKQIWDIDDTTDKPIKIKNSVIAGKANSNNFIKAGSEFAGEDTEIENFSLAFCNFAHYYLPEKLIPPDERQPKKLQIIVETLLNKKIKLWKNSENNRPGLFVIRENEKDYNQLVDHLYSHAAHLLDCVDLNGEETEELRHYLHSFINIRINEPDLGVFVIDLLTMQEAKKILNELMVRFYQKKMNTTADPYHHEVGNINYLFSQLIDTAKLSPNSSIRELKDWLLLAIMCNVCDVATEKARFITKYIHDFDSPKYNEIYGEILYNLFVKGYIHKDLMPSEIYKTLEKGNYINKIDETYFQFITDVQSEKSKELTTFLQSQDYVRDIYLFCQHTVETYQQDTQTNLKLLDNLLLDLQDKPKLFFMLSNLGGGLIEIEFINQVYKSLKQEGKPIPEFHIVVSASTVENDLDNMRLNDILNKYFNTDLLNHITIRKDHHSSILGKDLSQFDESLINDLKTGPVISFGMGNFICMQKAEFEAWHLFLSKGFIGPRIRACIEEYGNEETNKPIITKWAAGRDIRPIYQDKYCQKNKNE